MRLLLRVVRRPVCLLGLLAACGAPQERTVPPLTVAREPAAVESLRGHASVFAAMSNEEKAGQLFVSWIRADADDKERARIASFVKDVGLGGVILSIGSVEQAASVVEQMQANAKTPLLVAGDFEAGVAFRLTGATQMGNQMLVGASGLERLSRAMGRVTGEEARALGAPWVLAPVLDVNSNPNNPIINVRSFGEDQEFVARMGAAFVEGVERDASALACGKHFPGHGDTDLDSHFALPRIAHDRAR
jgi:beta-glucosidase-like glycosyl hydrolase